MNQEGNSSRCHSRKILRSNGLQPRPQSFGWLIAQQLQFSFLWETSPPKGETILIPRHSGYMWLSWCYSSCIRDTIVIKGTNFKMESVLCSIQQTLFHESHWLGFVPLHHWYDVLKVFNAAWEIMSNRPPSPPIPPSLHRDLPISFLTFIMPWGLPLCSFKFLRIETGKHNT